MTPPPPAPREPVAITQADREAADALDDALGFLTDIERPIILQAFARHRLAAAEQAREEALAIVSKWQGSDHMQLQGGEMTAQERRTVKAVLGAVEREIAAAIREPRP